MLRKKELIDWCWENLMFDNCPKTWENTYIVDIINGYKGTCRKHDGTLITYTKIRTMFE